MILASGYPVLTAANWLQHGCSISGCRLPHKVESKRFYIHWIPCGADGPTFLGWTDNQIFLAMGLRSRALCVRMQFRFKGQSTQILSQTRDFKHPHYKIVSCYLWKMSCHFLRLLLKWNVVSNFEDVPRSPARFYKIQYRGKWNLQDVLQCATDKGKYTLGTKLYILYGENLVLGCL